MIVNLRLLFGYLLFLVILAPSIGFAQITNADLLMSPAVKAQTDYVVGTSKGAELQLEVKEMPLAKVLESISIKSKVPIHYSVLPEGLVTATCVGSSVRQILDCLLARKADLIVRYSDDSGHDETNGQIAEAWILGSRIGDAVTPVDCSKGGTISKGTLSFQQRIPNSEIDLTDDLIKASQTKDAIQRAEAMGALMAGGRPGDPTVKAVLEKALTDQDANVRAQAISSLAHREGNGAISAIQEALHDSSADVRMMAVDGIIDDTALLQQAVNDSDETIRYLAQVKLDALLQSNKQ